MDQYRCKLCRSIRDFVYVCANKHLVCDKCVEEMPSEQHRCMCRTLLIDKVENPLISKVQNPCRYEPAGCLMKVTRPVAAIHELECDYRRVECIVSKLLINSCDWMGENRFSVKHMGTKHFHHLGRSQRNTAMAFLPFDAKTPSNILRVIEAYNRVFLFSYTSCPNNALVRFAFLLMGSQRLTNNFYVILCIKDDSDHVIKFDSKIGSSLDNLEYLMDEENCIAITHKTIRHYLVNGNIRFRYVLKTT